ncbi:hypothetical protein T11_17115 [Trichinella zimbabwensis]|uniref:Uncharacterized protein n=1 Tax=Trichinella zimbabwensis TaxID=268475 RepID=A0A0V1H1S3_9BILA|nr:hypothetical protein T11_17115 [Trichinella zimbabwensis]
MFLHNLSPQLGGKYPPSEATAASPDLVTSSLESNIQAQSSLFGQHARLNKNEQSKFQFYNLNAIEL